VLVTTDYANEATFEQELKVQALLRPDMIIWDEYSTAVDGHDAKRCAVVEHISKESAKELYGEDVIPYGKGNMVLNGTRWQAPEGSIEIVTYFKLKLVKTKIYQDEAGGVLPQEEVRKNSKMKSRNTTKTSCLVTKVCGNKVISETELPLTRLPVVPFLGEIIDVDNKVDFAGLTYFAKDPARLVNWLASLTAERIAIGPKSTIFVDYKSIAAYKDIWQQSNKLTLPFLPYDSKVEDCDQQFGPPTPRDAAVNVSDVTGASAMFSAMMSSIMGMPEGGAKQAGTENETAAAILTRAKSADLANFIFPDNASQSIKAVGQVILELLPVIYDTPRLMPIQNAEGSYEMQEIDLADLNVTASDWDVDVESGPLSDTDRQVTTSQLLALGTVVGPEAALTFAPELVRSLDFADSEKVAMKLEAYAKAKLALPDPAQQGEDPAAVAALEQASKATDALQAQLDQSRLVIQQLQAEVVGQRTIYDATIAKAQIDRQTKLEVEAMKIQGNMNAAQIKIQADADKGAQDARLDLQADLVKNANRPTQLIGGDIPNPVVQGQRNDIFR
jgi:hypothetical protein